MGNYGGLTVEGGSASENLGLSATGVGDVNNDGIDDFIVGKENDSGAYVIFGQSDGGLPANLSVADLQPSDGFEISAADGGYSNTFYFGDTVSGIGDINGDGIDDIAIGTVGSRYSYNYYDGNYANVSDRPGIFVIYGKDTSTDGAFADVVDVSALDGSDGFVVKGASGSVSSIESGDFNGDGIDDVLISQELVGGYYGGYYGEYVGQVFAASTATSDTPGIPGSENTPIAGYVIFGATDIAADGDLLLANSDGEILLDGEDGFAVEGVRNEGFGFYGEVDFSRLGGSGITSLGDVNGDGFDDIGLGNQRFGRTTQQVDDGNGGTYDRDYYYADSEAFIILGAASGNAIKTGQDDGTNVFWDNISQGGGLYDNPYDVLNNFGGAEVAGIGDVNGDGFDDVMISITNRTLLGERSDVAEDGDDARGVAGIIFGGPDGVDLDGDGPQDGLQRIVSLAASDVDGNLVNEPDVLVVNSNPDTRDFGGIIAGAGDINGDGVDDFLISDPSATINGQSYYGETFLVFGRDSGAGDNFPTILDLDNLSSGEAATTFYRFFQTNERFTDFGDVISAAGDVNGDGFDDLIITDERADVPGAGGSQTGSNAGRTWVVFGGSDQLEAADNADGANDNAINVANLGVDALTGAVPIVVSVANNGFLLAQSEGDTGATIFEFTVQRTGDLTEEVSFTYDVTGDGFSPANAGDFVGGSFPTDTVTFASGEPTAVVQIEVQGDNDIESFEDFSFNLLDVSTTGTSNVSIGVSSSLGRIWNDDFPASISIIGQSDDEAGELRFTVTRSGDSSSNVEVDFALTAAGFSAAQANDIAQVTADGVNLGGGLGQTGTLTFAPGETSKIVTVDPVNDDVTELTEYVQLSLSNLVADGPAQIARSSTTAGIFNDDFPPQILVDGGGFVTEGSGPGTTDIEFTITRRGDTSGVIEVTYDLNPQPAPGDFFAADSNDVVGFLPSFGNVVRFEDGESVKTIVVEINRDGIIEPRESFSLNITQIESFNGTSYDVIRSSANATILNDDGRPPVIPPGVEADVFGDPHIVTLDGLGYDFQAVGEYILVESTIPSDPRDFQVQVRFEPLEGSDLVSVTTRMSVDVGGKTIEIDALGASPILVDGVPITAQEIAVGAVDVDGDGTYDIFLDENQSEMFIVLNDLNEQLMVKNMDGVLNICVFLSDEAGGHANNVRGLMGNANGDTADDLTTRDGSVTYTDPTFEELYVDYADSWAVGAERNFSDAEGSGNFPDGFPAAKITVDDLPDAVLAAAIAAVDEAGITDPIIREAAILDFALTGDGDFVAGAAGLAADPTEEVDVTEAPELPLSVGVTPVETAVSEADGNPNTLFYTFYRLGDDTEEVVIDYAIGGDVDAADLVAGTPLTGQVTIAEGVGSTTLAIGVLNDDLTEGDERLTVTITGNDKGALVASGSGTTVIETDDFAPIANDDFFATSEDNTLVGNVLDANPEEMDTDANGDTLTVVSVEGFDPADGAITLNSGATLTMGSDGTFDYRAPDSLPAGDTLEDVFSYGITDGNGGFDTATAFITVTGENDDPVANDDDGATVENVAIDIDVLDNDTDVDRGAELTVARIVDGPDNGSVEINDDFTINYDPNTSFFGDDSFTYEVIDGDGGSSIGTVSVFVEAVDDPVEAADDLLVVLEDDETASTINVFDNDQDDEPKTGLTVTSFRDSGGVDYEIGEIQTTFGELFSLSADGEFTFNPNGFFENLGEGSEISGRFYYTVTDAGGNQDDAEIKVDIVGQNDDPVANDDDFSTDADTALSNLVVVANDTDVDDFDLLTVVGFDDTGTAGSVTLNPDGSFNYDGTAAYATLANGVVETDSFTYTIEDLDGAQSTATVSIDVTGTFIEVTDTPVEAFGDLLTVMEDDGSSSSINVFDNDQDVEPKSGLTVTSFRDNNGNELAIGQTLSVIGGLLSLSATGELSFDPNGEFDFLGQGDETGGRFSYTVTDAGGNSDDAEILIDVVGQNDAPTANDDDFGTDADVALTDLDVLGNDLDPDAFDVPSVISFDTTGTMGSVTQNQDGTFNYDGSGAYALLADGVVETDSFTYTIEDSQGEQSTATVSIDVTGTYVEVVNPPLVEVAGGDGREALNGTDADEAIISGLGSGDRMSGGGGNDAFVFIDEINNGVREFDFVLDFKTGEDSIFLSDEADYSIRFTSRYAMITDNNDGDRIFVYGDARSEDDLNITLGTIDDLNLV